MKTKHKDQSPRDNQLMNIIMDRTTLKAQYKSDAAWITMWDGDSEEEREEKKILGKPINEGYKRLAQFEARKYLNNFDDIEEVMSHIEYELHKMICADTFDREKAIIPWIATCVKNFCFNNIKKNMTRKTDSVGDVMDGKTGRIDSTAFAYFNFPDLSLSPRDKVQNTRLAEQIQATFNTLSDKDAEILHLQHVEEMSYEEISDYLGIKIGTTMSRIYNARKRFQEIWTFNFPQDSPRLQYAERL